MNNISPDQISETNAVHTRNTPGFISTDIQSDGQQSPGSRKKSYKISKLKNPDSDIRFDQIHEKNICRKILWALIFVIGSTVAFYRGIQFTMQYLSYPVMVNLQMEYGGSFPAVTVCNLNRIRGQYYKCFKKNTPIEKCRRWGKGFLNEPQHLTLSERRLLFSCNLFNKTILSEEEKETFFILSPFQQSEEDLKANSERKGMIELKKFLDIYLKAGEKNRQNYSNQAQDTVRWCSFNGEVCSWKNFTLTQSFRHGNCFTFKRNKSQTSAYLFETRGLELILDLSIENYMPYVTPSKGFKIVVHDPTENPNVEEHGFYVFPGTETDITLVKNQFNRLPTPYQDECKNYGSGTTHVDECIRLCIQQQSFDKCGCVDPTIFEKRHGQHFCDVTNATNSCCLDDAIDSMLEEKTSTCDCPFPCKTTSFTEQISKADWPSVEYFKKHLLDKLDLSFDLRKLARFKEGFLMLRVHQEFSGSHVFQQEPMHQSTEVLSNFGNDIGLFLGLSLAVIFEVVELILRFAKQFLMKVKILDSCKLPDFH